MNPRIGRRRGTAEFLGRDEGTIRHPDQPLPQSRRLSGRLGRPRRCVWCSPRFACSEMTPVLQPRTMKRADVATNVSPADRPDKPGRMKNQDFSSPLNVRPLDFLAIDGFGAAMMRPRATSVDDTRCRGTTPLPRTRNIARAQNEAALTCNQKVA